jgi:hypothetical protein
MRLVFTLIALVAPALAAEEYTCSFTQGVVALGGAAHEAHVPLPGPVHLEAITKDKGFVRHYYRENPRPLTVSGAQVVRNDGGEILGGPPLPAELAPNRHMVTFIEMDPRPSHVAMTSVFLDKKTAEGKLSAVRSSHIASRFITQDLGECTTGKRVGK